MLLLSIQKLIKSLISYGGGGFLTRRVSRTWTFNKSARRVLVSSLAIIRFTFLFCNYKIISNGLSNITITFKFSNV
jgi:hypothetical protein